MWPFVGSSPRVRGSPGFLSGSCAASGIIPAGAGLTFMLALLSAAARDHPRGCGAHRYRIRYSAPASGSSPRVRGSRIVRVSLLATAGIIPAGAGLTLHIPGHRLSAGDHPRGCGAHLTIYFTLTWIVGSSPRVRGSLGQDRRHLARPGIIPAGAGLTRGRRS